MTKEQNKAIYDYLQGKANEFNINRITATTASEGTLNLDISYDS